MKQITQFEIVDHGIEHEQYFQGCGVSYTDFDECYTGIGDSLQAALADATDNMPYEIPKELNVEIDQADNKSFGETQHTDCGDENCFSQDTHYYASIRIKLE